MSTSDLDQAARPPRCAPGTVPPPSCSAAGDCEAVVLPSLGMLVASFTHRGDELVALPGGLAGVQGRAHDRDPAALPVGEPPRARPVPRGRTSTWTCAASTSTPTTTACRSTGSMLARPEWEVTRLGAGPRSARLAARFDFGAHEDLMAAFPFPHELAVDVTLAASGLRDRDHGAAERAGQRSDRVRVAPVPAAARRATRHVGARAPGTRARRARRTRHPDGPGPSGRRPRPRRSPGATSTTSSRSARTGSSRSRRSDRRLTITYDDGYPYAQMYSPTGKPFCAIEPMTAPTNALVSGDHPSVRPGETFSAAFTLAVADVKPPGGGKRRRSDQVLGWSRSRSQRRGIHGRDRGTSGRRSGSEPVPRGRVRSGRRRDRRRVHGHRRAAVRSRRRLRAQRVEPEVRAEGSVPLVRR